MRTFSDFHLQAACYFSTPVLVSVTHFSQKCLMAHYLMVAKLTKKCLSLVVKIGQNKKARQELFNCVCEEGKSTV